jgi:hypothetical protein
MRPNRNPHSMRLPAVKLADVPSEHFVFAFVRNPWDRLVSRYRDKVGGEPGVSGTAQLKRWRIVLRSYTSLQCSAGD